MSTKHPVIAVTGSSGAGTTTVKNAFEHIFFRENIKPLVLEGDSFHCYDRAAMKDAIAEFAKQGKQLSHFGPEANHFDLIAETFKNTLKPGTVNVAITCTVTRKRHFIMPASAQTLARASSPRGKKLPKKHVSYPSCMQTVKLERSSL